MTEKEFNALIEHPEKLEGKCFCITEYYADLKHRSTYYESR